MGDTNLKGKEMQKTNDFYSTLSKIDYKVLLKRYGIILVFLFLSCIITILTPNFLTPSNLINVVRQISMIAIVASGTTMIMISGGIDISVGSVIALTGISAAFFAKGDYPIFVPILVGLAVGALCGMLNGIAIAKGKMAPMIVTLGMMSVARGVSFVITNGKPVFGLSKEFNFIGRGDIFLVPTPIIILVAIILITHIILKKLKFGKYVYAIGGNETAAKVSGLNVDKIKILIYTYAGAMAGVAGIVLASRIQTGQPNAGLGYEMDAIAAAVIGGTSLSGGVGNVFGTLVGALIINVVNNGLDLLNVSSYYQQIAKGLIIGLAVFLDTRKNK